MLQFGNIIARGHIEADSGRFRGRLEANEGILENVKVNYATIGVNVDFQGTINAKEENAKFRVVSDTETPSKIIPSLSAANLRTRIASEFGITASDIYSFSYGFMAVSTSSYRFDTIIFSNNTVTFYMNGNVVYGPVTSTTASMTLRMGSNNIVMVYNAPTQAPSTVNGVYRWKDTITGRVYLLLKE